MEELEEEYETDFVDELDDLEENESDDESEENHGERQKRGLGWLNKQKPQKNCVGAGCGAVPKDPGAQKGGFFTVVSTVLLLLWHALLFNRCNIKTVELFL